MFKASMRFDVKDPIKLFTMIPDLKAESDNRRAECEALKQRLMEYEYELNQ